MIMPVTPTYPGVYIEELPSGVRTIVGVATSITAFVGRAPRGPANDPVRIQGFGDYTRTFGGLSMDSTMGYAVEHYFRHGGSDALIVRVHNGAAAATITLPAGGDNLTLAASSEGSWGNRLKAIVDHETKDKDDASPDTNLFNLTVREVDPATQEILAQEVFLNVSRDATASRSVKKMLKEESALVRVQGTVPAARPDATAPSSVVDANADGGNGSDITDTEISDSSLKASREGMYALDKADLFNLLCIPPLTRDTDVGSSTTLAAAAKYCKDKRAVLIVDPPSGWNDGTTAETGIDSIRSDIGTDSATNTAVYFPRLNMADPLQENRSEEFVPCGAVAGIFARTDAQRGVWKAPAGIEASLVGVRSLSYRLTDGENGRLNPLGLNSLRTFPVVGHVCWGARSLAGADRLSSEWKYVPVRRTALYIEESLFRGTQWAVFEPNDEPLWAQLRLNVGAFMQDLFRQGAFQGTSPREAYFVTCDKETTTQNDIDKGIVNILVGFAPLKPAEFVIIKIQQIAGQIET